MEEFKNNPINTFELPKFEEVTLTKLHPKYFKVMLFNVALLYFILGVVASVALYFIEEIHPYWYVFSSIYVTFLVITVFITRIKFKNRGFAFRTHDVIYRSGAIAINTTIVPYNRIQHVALHEGLMSRALGLAAIEIFTAGGDSSDVKIPGLEKEHAEKIKALLRGKVLNEEEVNESEL